MKSNRNQKHTDEYYFSEENIFTDKQHDYSSSSEDEFDYYPLTEVSIEKDNSLINSEVTKDNSLINRKVTLEDTCEDIINDITSQLPYKHDVINLGRVSKTMNQMVKHTATYQKAQEIAAQVKTIETQPNPTPWGQFIRNLSCTARVCLPSGALGLIIMGAGLGRFGLAQSVLDNDQTFNIAIKIFTGLGGVDSLALGFPIKELYDQYALFKSGNSNSNKNKINALLKELETPLSNGNNDEENQQSLLQV